MIKDNVLSLTGYGIMPYPAIDREHPIIIVNMADSTVGFEKSKKTYTFEDFIGKDEIEEYNHANIS